MTKARARKIQNQIQALLISYSLKKGEEAAMTPIVNNKGEYVFTVTLRKEEV
jgi:hypothetical protein